MATVKTAISLPEPLLADVEDLAQEMRTSRSGVFVIAIEELLRRRRNRRMLDQLNQVYKEPLSPDEEDLLQRWRKPHRKLVEDR